jgi:hypothetical protein
MFELSQLFFQHLLRPRFDRGDLLLGLGDPSLAATQFFFTAVEHLRAPVQACFALADALLEALQLFASFRGFVFELGFGSKPVFLGFEHGFFTFALQFLIRGLAKATRFLFDGAQFAFNAELA